MEDPNSAIRKSARSIEALGPVNPQALEEYQEAQQRYEFLNTQRQDLLDSIRDTEKAIQELDTESRRRFKEAFEGINAHFQADVPDPVRRRPGRDAPDRRDQSGRKRHRHRGVASGQAAAERRCCFRAARNR